MVDINKLVSKHYFDAEELLSLIQEQLSQTRVRLFEQTPPPETEVGESRDIVLKLPIFRLSEKMWGKEGTEDRAIIENIMSKIIAKGNTLKDKIRILRNFIQSPPQARFENEVFRRFSKIYCQQHQRQHFV